jgi:hypothetical protein
MRSMAIMFKRTEPVVSASGGMLLGDILCVVTMAFVFAIISGILA